MMDFGLFYNSLFLSIKYYSKKLRTFKQFYIRHASRYV